MRNLVIILSFITLFSCGTPKELKTVNWKGNQITWTVLDGGATTSYYWQIFFTKEESHSRKLIFESYSWPYITDISNSNNQLLIHCHVDSNSTNTIVINLNKIDDFIENPIKYQRSMLEQTNESFNEPEFIKRDREFAIEHKLTN